MLGGGIETAIPGLGVTEKGPPQADLYKKFAAEQNAFVRKETAKKVVQGMFEDERKWVVKDYIETAEKCSDERKKTLLMPKILRDYHGELTRLNEALEGLGNKDPAKAMELLEEKACQNLHEMQQIAIEAKMDSDEYTNDQDQLLKKRNLLTEITDEQREVFANENAALNLWEKSIDDQIRVAHQNWFSGPKGKLADDPAIAEAYRKEFETIEAVRIKHLTEMPVSSVSLEQQAVTYTNVAEKTGREGVLYGQAVVYTGLRVIEGRREKEFNIRCEARMKKTDDLLIENSKNDGLIRDLGGQPGNNEQRRIRREEIRVESITDPREQCQELLALKISPRVFEQYMARKYLTLQQEELAIRNDKWLAEQAKNPSAQRQNNLRNERNRLLQGQLQQVWEVYCQALETYRAKQSSITRPFISQRKTGDLAKLAAKLMITDLKDQMSTLSKQA